MPGGIFRAGRWHERAAEIGYGAPLGDQVQFPCPGDGLGAVGGAELVQHVADVFFDAVTASAEHGRRLAELGAAQTVHDVVGA